MYFARDGQDKARSHLKFCLRVFSLSGPKDDGKKADEDVDRRLIDDSRMNQTYY